MNTRLQVEHPVTELAVTVAGELPLDLVEWQLRVAAGSRCRSGRTTWDSPGTRSRAGCTGDPARGFLPTGAPGAPAGRVDLPGSGSTGLSEGSVVGGGYDPMLAKVIAWGPDRPAALHRLGLALSRSRCSGSAPTWPSCAPCSADPEAGPGGWTPAWPDGTPPTCPKRAGEAGLRPRCWPRRRWGGRWSWPRPPPGRGHPGRLAPRPPGGTTWRWPARDHRARPGPRGRGQRGRRRSHARHRVVRRRRPGPRLRWPAAALRLGPGRGDVLARRTARPGRCRRPRRTVVRAVGRTGRWERSAARCRGRSRRAGHRGEECAPGSRWSSWRP